MASRSGWEVVGVFLGAAGIAGAIAFGTRRAHAATTSSRIPDQTPPWIPPAPEATPPTVTPSVQAPTVEAWRPYVRRLLFAFGFGPEAESFVMNYITMESGGRPCSVGFPGELDAQGQPLESGIGQFMSPHDIKLAGTTVAEMRAACSSHVAFPGLTRRSPQAEIDAARALTEKQIRPLTEDEKTRQVVALLTFLSGIRTIVEHSFRNHLVSWPKTSADYWAMIKGYHAGQSFPTAGLDAAVKALGGRAPKTWGEFVSAYLSTIGDANLRARHAHALDNARRAGAGSGLPWLAPAATVSSGEARGDWNGRGARFGVRSAA